MLHRFFQRAFFDHATQNRQGCFQAMCEVAERVPVTRLLIAFVLNHAVQCAGQRRQLTRIASFDFGLLAFLDAGRASAAGAV